MITEIRAGEKVEYMEMESGIGKSRDNKPANNMTAEQLAIVNAVTDLRINAVAGSGKTTTMIEYAASRPTGSRILYLAFNRSVKLEAIRKFELRGLANVKVETAHSLAYKYIVHRNGYTVRKQDFKVQEIAELLGLPSDGERHAEYIIANHIKKFITYFCNSDGAKVQELNYAETVADDTALKFVRSFYRIIEEGTRKLLAKMNSGEIAVTHDFYLKKFQLSQPSLPFDYILFDEGQDASPAMLNIFLNQSATRLIVGDTHQQIYGWRHAVNSLEKAKFSSLQLSTSFRFGPVVAELAAKIIQWKKYVGDEKQFVISGNGKETAIKTKAIIARTNLGLLLSAITYITLNKKTKHIYFEGNLNSYTYADDGASLYDVLNLFNGKSDQIRDPLIRTMKDMSDLEEYIEKTEDMQLSMMAEIVKEYENDIYPLMQTLKSLHTGDEDRSKAEVIFSTVHRAKGMEYDSVELVPDFINEAKLQKFEVDEEKKNDPREKARLTEEINLLYVAVTRAKVQLRIPDALLPETYQPGTGIIVIPVKKESTKNTPSFQQKENTPKRRNLKFIGRRLKETGTGTPEKGKYTRPAKSGPGGKGWSTEQQNELRELYEKQLSIAEMATYFGRTETAINTVLKKLNYFNN